MAVYTYFACELTTGRVVSELPLAAFSGERHLKGGAMSASMALVGRVDGSDLLAYTTPGKYTIVAERDGVIMGEWIIWKRSRINDFSPVQLFGNEVISYLSHRILANIDPGQVSPFYQLVYKQTDQAAIANAMAQTGFRGRGLTGAGAVTMNYVTPATGVRRDRTYLAGEASIGQRLAELGNVIGGFDVTIEAAWSSVGGFRYVARTFTTWYPQAGLIRPFMFDMGGTVRAGQAGNALSFSLDEDAIILAGGGWAVGSDAKLVYAYSDRLASRGYPFLEVAGSYTDITTTDALGDKARAELVESAVLPPTLSVLADGEPGIGDYQLGDQVSVNVEPSTNFPGGFQTTVRIIGWTLKPPNEGAEVIDLAIDGGQ